MKIQKYLLLAGMMLTAAAACACGSPAAKEKTLTICADGNGLGESYLGPILAEFQSQNPDITLQVTYLPPMNSTDKAMAEERTAALTRTRTELMSGEGADLYLFFNRAVSAESENYMLFPNLERQIAGGVFHDLDFLFEHPDFHEADYIAAIDQAGVYEDAAYVLPLSYDCPAMIALSDPLLESGFDEAAATACTTAYVDALLALPEEQRPYLTATLPALLLNVPSVPPVLVSQAQIQLNTPVWQDLLQKNRQVTEAYPDTEDAFFLAMDFDTCIADGAVFLAGASADPAYSLRLLEDSGSPARLLPIPNENGSLTVMPYLTAAVSSGCDDTDTAARLLLFLLSDTVQGCEVLESGGSNARLISSDNSWPVRRGCAVRMTEQITRQPVTPGEISDALKVDLQHMEERADTCRLAGRYDAGLSALIDPYLKGTKDWEECYAAIEKEWSYLDE